MQPQDYADLYALEEQLWWFAGMREITAALLDPVCSCACGVSVAASWRYLNKVWRANRSPDLSAANTSAAKA